MLRSASVVSLLRLADTMHAVLTAIRVQRFPAIQVSPGLVLLLWLA